MVHIPLHPKTKFHKVSTVCFYHWHQYKSHWTHKTSKESLRNFSATLGQTHAVALATSWVHAQGQRWILHFVSCSVSWWIAGHCKVSVWAYLSSAWTRLTRWGQRLCPVWARACCACPGVMDHDTARCELTEARLGQGWLGEDRGDALFELQCVVVLE